MIVCFRVFGHTEHPAIGVCLDVVWVSWGCFFCVGCWRDLDETKIDLGVSLNGGTPKTPQNDHF